MRISCCAAMYSGQCNDCPLTAPIRPTELMPGPSQQEAIDAAYERAAQVCDDTAQYPADNWDRAFNDGAHRCADRIRALKGKPLKPEE